jgi:DNA-binding CsgD family transcriptional regulator
MAAMAPDDAVDFALEFGPEAAGAAGDRPAPAPVPAGRAVGHAADGPVPLTRREREVAVLVAAGVSNRQIASRLTITERTAENHVGHVLAKLGVRSRAAIGAWAAQQGLLTETPGTPLVRQSATSRRLRRSARLGTRYAPERGHNGT